jgi:hypothetical protein
MDSLSFDKTIQVIQEQKINFIVILDRHKMLQKRKTRMNIPLCQMISMPVVCLAMPVMHLAFKIDVLKME